MLTVVAGKAREQAGEPRLAARAAAHHGPALFDPHALFMIEAIKQAARRDVRIDQLIGLDRVEQGLGVIEIRLGVAARLVAGDALDQRAARAPDGMPAGQHLAAHRQPQA